MTGQSNDAHRWSPAHVAVENYDLETLRRLLEAGADVNDPDDAGFSLLHHAIDVERDAAAQHGTPLGVEMTKLLLAFHPDLTIRDDHGLTPLQTAEALGHHLAAELIRTSS